MVEMHFKLGWCVVALAASAALGCQSGAEQPKPMGSSESHFLRSCSTESECAGELACTAGVCTLACTAGAECDALASGASCVNHVCDLLCDGPADCTPLDPALTCVGGRCRDPRAAEPASDDGGAVPSDGAVDAGGDGAGGASGDAASPGPDEIPEPVIVDPMPGSKRHACVAYELARRSRQAECRRVPDSGLSLLVLGDTCPGLFFTDGSTATVESLYACAEAWRTFPCLETIFGGEPACVTRGTGTTGELCRFDAQCESGSCNTVAASGSPLCNTCDVPLAAGDDCSGDLVSSCGRLTTCVDEVCVAVESTMRALGESCEYDEQCPLPHVCVTFTEGPPFTCVERAALHEPCGRSRNGANPCAEGLLCTVDHRCEAPAPAGEPCTTQADASVLITGCEDTGYCDDGGMCRPLPGEGEACVPREYLTWRCERGLGCYDGTCVPAGEPGAPCQAPYFYPERQSCREGLLCTCADESCAGDGVCLQVLPEGADCSGEHTVCALRSECIANVCVADDTITPSESSCAP